MTFDEEVAAGLRFPPGDPRYGQFVADYGPLATDPTGMYADPSLGGILKSIATAVGNVVLPGVFGGGGTTIPFNPNMLLPGALPTAPTTPVQPQIGQIVTGAALAFPGAAKWVSMAWKALQGGAAIASVVSFIQSAIPTTEQTATAVVAKAIRTRGGHRHMNPLNPRALRRAITRVNRFDHFAHATEKMLQKHARRRRR